MGKFIKGTSGNPSGRRKSDFSLSAACQKHGEEIVTFMLAVPEKGRPASVGSGGWFGVCVEIAAQCYGYVASSEMARKDKAVIELAEDLRESHALGKLRAEADRLRTALQAVADEAGQHHEHNPISGVDRLPLGYTKILNLADAALNPPNRCGYGGELPTLAPPRTLNGSRSKIRT